MDVMDVIRDGHLSFFRKLWRSLVRVTKQRCSGEITARWEPRREPSPTVWFRVGHAQRFPRSGSGGGVRPSVGWFHNR